MFDHVTIRVADRDASQRFYETALAALGVRPTHEGDDLVEWDDFSLAAARPGSPVTRGLHIGFAAPSREAVDAFWRAGTEAGYQDDGPPGPRPVYGPDYYGGFLLDPDGNSAEAVRHETVLGDAVIDHLWIRVADVGASRAFYAALAPFAGLRMVRDTPDRVRFALDSGGSFSVVAGPPSEHVHMAFTARDDATVDAFHGALVAAGGRDNGAPGERPRYHPGYYGAYVLDPDGHNVEMVNHHRTDLG